MATSKRMDHSWTRRPHTERRAAPRVRASFPILLDIDDNAPPLQAMTLDLGMGGVRAEVPKYFELFTRYAIRFELPVTRRDGEIVMEPIETTVAIVRIEPDEEGPPGTVYDVGLAFSRLTEAEERTLALFQLQMLLFDADVELL